MLVTLGSAQRKETSISKGVVAARRRSSRGQRPPASPSLPPPSPARRPPPPPRSTPAASSFARRQEPAPRGHRPARAVRDHHGLRRRDAGDGERARRHVGRVSERGAPRLGAARRPRGRGVARMCPCGDGTHARQDAIIHPRSPTSRGYGDERPRSPWFQNSPN
jgi:hypothetical protein